MMDVLRLITLAVLAVLFVILVYSWMECEKEREKLKKLLEEEGKKLRSETENRERAERKVSAANAFIEKLTGQNKELEARLTRLWEETARLRKPAGVAQKR